jgi:hypothetical protein
MSLSKTTDDLKREAKRQIAEKTDLYEDVLVYLMDNYGIIEKSHLIKEMMRRITYTDSSFEHLVE